MSSNNSARTQIEALLELIHSSTQAAMSEYEKTGHGIPSPDSMKSHPLDHAASALPLRRVLRILEGACERLCTTLAQPMHTLVNRSMSFEGPCLKFVTEQKIADVLETTPGGMHIEDIAARAKNRVASDKLGQVMLLLATRGCFKEVSKDVYANNRISFPLLSTNPVSSIISLTSGEILRGITMLPEALVHPEYAFSKMVNRTCFSYSIRREMKDASHFDWIKENPYAGKRFQRAMAGFSVLTGSSDAVIQAYPWEELMPPAGSGKGLLTFCDVGSGPGAVALALSKFHNDRFGIVLQDLPEVLEQAKTLWSAEHPGGDVDFVPLDFLKESPVQGQDVYYLSHVLHNWPDSDAIIILKNIAKAMNDSNRLIINDVVLEHTQRDRDGSGSSETAPEPLLPNYGSGNIRSYNQSILMLSNFNSRERTREDFLVLGQESGLKLVKIWPLSETCLIEFRLAS